MDAADDTWRQARAQHQADSEQRGAEREAAESAARRAAQRAARFQGESLQETLGRAVAPGRGGRAVGVRYLRAVGADPFGSEPWLEEVIERAAQEGARLATSIPEQYLLQLSRSVEEAVRSGVSAAQLAQRIQRDYLQPDEGRLGQAQRRAQLIASDQIGRVTAQVTQRRQEGLGVERYTWRTSRDERVRSEHRARDGQIFTWSSPPPGGHPGEPVRCRCYAEPVIPGIDD